ncbi:MAG TPA: hypothetical protein VGW34_08610 [Allosphingosinicella sp.]|nr:hypothetical protein [Allosphingosinicella sp.]
MPHRPAGKVAYRLEAGSQRILERVGLRSEAGHFEYQLRLARLPLQLCFRLPPLRDVPQEADEDAIFENGRGRDRQLDRKLAPVLVEGGNLDPAVEHPLLPGLVEPRETIAMELAILRRDDEVRHRPADRFCVRPAESLLRHPVPIGDGAIAMHHHDRVERGVEERTEGFERRLGGLAQHRTAGGWGGKGRICTEAPKWLKARIESCG